MAGIAKKYAVRIIDSKELLMERVVTDYYNARERCYRKILSAVKTQCRKFHQQENLHMYPYVRGEFKPVERHTNASSLGKSGRAEAGMKHKGLYNFL